MEKCKNENLISPNTFEVNVEKSYFTILCFLLEKVDDYNKKLFIIFGTLLWIFSMKCHVSTYLFWFWGLTSCYLFKLWSDWNLTLEFDMNVLKGIWAHFGINRIIIVLGGGGLAKSSPWSWPWLSQWVESWT